MSLLLSIFWFCLGSLVTAIIMHKTRPGITVKEIDPIVVLRAKEKANMSGRAQLVTITEYQKKITDTEKDQEKNTVYNIRDAVKEWTQPSESEHVICKVYPDKRWAIPEITQR